MKTPRTRTLIGTGAAAVALLGGIALATGAPASAQVPAGSHIAAAPADGETQDGAQDGVTGSLKVPSTNSASESGESAALQGAAKVSTAEAENAALSAVPGTVVKSGLGDENGWLIYEVTVKGTSGATTEVKVDAGNGKVLAHEAAGADSETGQDAETHDGAQG